MKIYRGPSQKDFQDETHQLVDEVDLKNTAPWVKSTRIKVNISKDANERQAVARIDLESSDVLKLHQSLLQGLMAQATQCELIEKKASDLQRALQRIQIKAMHSSADTLAEIKVLAESALKQFAT